tara:strand:- start:312 stop:629 length:318 start_codon:yes stop_codon:yes gene_type:complete
MQNIQTYGMNARVTTVQPTNANQTEEMGTPVVVVQKLQYVVHNSPFGITARVAMGRRFSANQARGTVPPVAIGPCLPFVANSARHLNAHRGLANSGASVTIPNSI